MGSLARYAINRTWYFRTDIRLRHSLAVLSLASSWHDIEHMICRAPAISSLNASSASPIFQGPWFKNCGKIAFSANHPRCHSIMHAQHANLLFSSKSYCSFKDCRWSYQYREFSNKKEYRLSSRWILDIWCILVARTCGGGRFHRFQWCSSSVPLAAVERKPPTDPCKEILRDQRDRKSASSGKKGLHQYRSLILRSNPPSTCEETIFPCTLWKLASMRSSSRKCNRRYSPR